MRIFRSTKTSVVAMNINQRPDLLSQLPKAVNNILDAEAVLLALARSNKMYHFDDDPHYIDCFTTEEADVLQVLMQQMDEVTRVHYRMESDPIINVGIWDGLVKDLLPIGFLLFGADDSGATLYVYNYEDNPSTTTIEEWNRTKALALEDDGESYDYWVIHDWLLGRVHI